MKIQKILLSAVIFILSTVITIFTVLVRDGLIVDSMGLPKGLGLLLAFGLFFVWYIACVSLFRNKLGIQTITTIILIPPLVILGMKALSSSFKYFLKQTPYYLAVIFGFMAAYAYSVKFPKKLTIPLALGIFPLLMSLGIYDLWVHRIEYGTFTGNIKQEHVPAFELHSKDGTLVSNESLKGKLVVLDFWYIGCRPCWVKFPELEKLYHRYQANDKVAIFAVNRPMSYDKPGALFTRTTEKGYTFPVLKGTQKVMDDLEIYVYPTVLVLNQHGEIVFKGEIEAVSDKLEELLNS